MNFKIYGYSRRGVDNTIIAVIRHVIMSIFQEVICEELIITVVDSDATDYIGKDCPYLEVVDDKQPSTETLNKLRVLAKELGVDIEVPQPLLCFISK